eukprot:1155392-Pelagomonas_calceolata.AAC.1
MEASVGAFMSRDKRAQQMLLRRPPLALHAFFCGHQCVRTFANNGLPLLRLKPCLVGCSSCALELGMRAAGARAIQSLH